jgi:hypothetical protein
MKKPKVVGWVVVFRLSPNGPWAKWSGTLHPRSRAMEDMESCRRICPSREWRLAKVVLA